MPPDASKAIEEKFNSIRQRDGIDVLKERDLRHIEDLIGHPEKKIVLADNSQKLESQEYKLVFCVQGSRELSRFSCRASIRKGNPQKPGELKPKMLGDGEWTRITANAANVHNFYYLYWDWNQTDPYMALDNYDVTIAITDVDFITKDVFMEKHYNVEITNEDREKRKKKR
ncbi:MAG: hypothetical protein A4E35_01925 [Methanoregula sp. PtaU1.Bin051]|nr:MAG: hypothetical protein A4E35_01925 [Methanoregula sp. PtaU1.Bin051]